MKKHLSAAMSMAVLLGTVGALPAGSSTESPYAPAVLSASAADLEYDENQILLHNTFEDGQGSSLWSGRVSANVAVSSDQAYQGSSSLYVTERNAAYCGATTSLAGDKFLPGSAYSFSVVVRYETGVATTKFHLTIQFEDSAGKTDYAKIASVDVPKGQWVQLANKSFTIPDGASSVKMYIETDSGTGNFYIDEAIIAPDGTNIPGPKPLITSLGDPTGDGCITAADLAVAKSGVLNGFTNNAVKSACDVNYDKEVTIADVVWFHKYLMGEETVFPEKIIVEPEVQPMRTISEYTPVVEAQMVMKEPDNSHNENPGTQYGTITKKEYFSKKANKNKPYNILLPANYDESKQYPVLYLLHGFFENEDRMITKGNGVMYTRQIIGNAIAAGEAEDMIVVVPLVFTHPTLSGAVSFQDYESSVGYDNFVDDIVDSLMPHIEENYSVKTGRENTAVTGFSMGGRESLRIGMKYPDKFGYVGAICPAPGVEGPWSWSEEAAPSIVLLTGGTNDDVVGLSTPEGYHNNFNKASTPHIWHVVQGGYHGDNCIHAHVYNFVRAIFKA